MHSFDALALVVEEGYAADDDELTADQRRALEEWLDDAAPH